MIPQHGAADIKIQTADNKSSQLHVNLGDTNIKIHIIYSVNGDSGDGEIADKVESIIPDAIRQAFKFQTAYNKITQLKG